MKECECSVEVRRRVEPRESVPGLFQCPECGGKRKTMVIDVGGRQLTVEHLEEREVKDGQLGVTCPEVLHGTTHSCGLPKGHTGPHMILAKMGSQEATELNAAFFQKDMPADMRVERVEARATLKAGPCDHPVEGTRCPKCAIGPTAQVCEACQGSGRLHLPQTIHHHPSTPEGSRTSQCGSCGGFGWLWSDGKRAKECVEKQAVCGRATQCASCPHKEEMAWGPSALRAVLNGTVQGKVVFLMKTEAHREAVRKAREAPEEKQKELYADLVLANSVYMMVHPDDPMFNVVNHCQVLASDHFPSQEEVLRMQLKGFSIGGVGSGGKPC